MYLDYNTLFCLLVVFSLILINNIVKYFAYDTQIINSNDRYHEEEHALSEEFLHDFFLASEGTIPQLIDEGIKINGILFLLSYCVRYG